MEKKPPLHMTPFDVMVTTDMLQTMKLMIPYLPPEFQRMAGIYAKLTELQNVMYYFQPPYYHSRRGRLRQKEMNLDSIMEDLGPYLPPESKDMLNMFSQAMGMMEMMKSMNMEDMMSSMNMADMMSSMNMADMMQSMNTEDGNMEDVMNAFQTERTDTDERMDQPPSDGEHRSAETGID